MVVARTAAEINLAGRQNPSPVIQQARTSTSSGLCDFRSVDRRSSGR